MLQQENQLVKSVSIENLIQQRNAILERTAKVAALDLEIQAISQAAEVRVSRAEYRSGRSDSTYAQDPEWIRADIDAQFWNRLMNESGLRTFMDSERRKKWDGSIYNPKPDVIPQFTEENIKATFATLHSQRDEMVIDGVVEVFRQLSWCYKTNNPVKFGKKIITRVGGFYSYGADKLDDLDRVMHILDGKPEPDFRHSLKSAISKSSIFGCKRQTLETPYLRVECYKNGNGHVTFKNEGFVAKLNNMIAIRFPGCLPSGRGE